MPLYKPKQLPLYKPKQIPLHKPKQIPLHKPKQIPLYKKKHCKYLFVIVVLTRKNYLFDSGYSFSQDSIVWKLVSYLNSVGLDLSELLDWSLDIVDEVSTWQFATIYQQPLLWRTKSRMVMVMVMVYVVLCCRSANSQYLTGFWNI